MSTAVKPAAAAAVGSSPVPQTSQKAKTLESSGLPESSSSSSSSSSVNPATSLFRQQPEDLDVTRNNEATNEFQAKTIELRNQRPQWITYYQLLYIFH